MLCNLNGMLTYLNMQFEGNPHSGLDDSYNISRICLQLLEDGAFLDQNERIVSLKTPAPFGKDVIIFLNIFYIFIIINTVKYFII